MKKTDALVYRVIGCLQLGLRTRGQLQVTSCGLRVSGYELRIPLDSRFRKSAWRIAASGTGGPNQCRKAAVPWCKSIEAPSMAEAPAATAQLTTGVGFEPYIISKMRCRGSNQCESQSSGRPSSPTEEALMIKSA